MTHGKQGDGEAARLWQRAREPWRAAVGTPGQPEASMLAAYLEGRLDEAAAEAVEAWLATDPEALDSVLAARAALGETPAAAPRHLIARAQGAVRRRGIHGATGADSVFGGFAGLLRPAAWAGMAAALLLVSVSGFELGRMGVERLASLDAAVAQDVRLVMGPSGQDFL